MIQKAPSPTPLLLLAALTLGACAGRADRASAGADAPAPARPGGASAHLESWPALPSDELRRLHGRALAAPPTPGDLEGEVRLVAEACLADSEGDRCTTGAGSLPAPDRALVREVVAGAEPRARDVEERRALCARGDAALLQAAYPGHFAFLQQVATPPASPLEPVDAVVAVGPEGSLVSRAQRLLERGLAGEALVVQVPAAGTSSGFSPEPDVVRDNATPGLFLGYYTPRIEGRMAAPRPDCDGFRSLAVVQGACRRDLTVSIVRDWMEARGHRSVRILLGQQTTWPEFDLLFERLMPEVERSFDPDFDIRLSRSSSILSEMCGPPATEELWQDYPFYVRTLFREG